MAMASMISARKWSASNTSGLMRPDGLSAHGREAVTVGVDLDLHVIERMTGITPRLAQPQARPTAPVAPQLAIPPASDPGRHPAPTNRL